MLHLLMVKSNNTYIFNSLKIGKLSNSSQTAYLSEILQHSKERNSALTFYIKHYFLKNLIKIRLGKVAKMHKLSIVCRLHTDNFREDSAVALVKVLEPV